VQTAGGSVQTAVPPVLSALVCPVSLFLRPLRGAVQNAFVHSGGSKRAELSSVSLRLRLHHLDRDHPARGPAGRCRLIIRLQRPSVRLCTPMTCVLTPSLRSLHGESAHAGHSVSEIQGRGLLRVYSRTENFSYVMSFHGTSLYSPAQNSELMYASMASVEVKK